MIDNTFRFGRFTSSQIHRLTTQSARPMTEHELAAYKAENPKGRKTTIMDWPGVAASSYIEEKRFERKLKRALNTAGSSRPTDWGTVCEGIAFELLGLDYQIVSEKTLVHPIYDNWAGSPDLDKQSQKVIGDLKCPYTLKSFCQLVDYGISGGITEIRERHDDGEKYYWQLVSNACIKGYTKAELIVFAPKEDSTIRYNNQSMDVVTAIYDESDSYGFNWIRFADRSSLPILPPGSDYNMVNIIAFDVPQSDIDYLESCVKKGTALLDGTFRIHDQNITIYDTLPG